MADDPTLEKYNTPEARAEYARRCRDYAAWLRLIGDHDSAELNVYLSDLYDGRDVHWYLCRFTEDAKWVWHKS